MYWDWLYEELVQELELRNEVRLRFNRIREQSRDILIRLAMDYEFLEVFELAKILGRRRLDETGGKNTLIQRLRRSDDDGFMFTSTGTLKSLPDVSHLPSSSTGTTFGKVYRLGDEARFFIPNIKTEGLGILASKVTGVDDNASAKVIMMAKAFSNISPEPTLHDFMTMIGVSISDVQFDDKAYISLVKEISILPQSGGYEISSLDSLAQLYRENFGGWQMFCDAMRRKSVLDMRVFSSGSTSLNTIYVFTLWYLGYIWQLVSFVEA